MVSYRSALVQRWFGAAVAVSLLGGVYAKSDRARQTSVTLMRVAVAFVSITRG
jgi:hypothetical protein